MTTAIMNLFLFGLLVVGNMLSVSGRIQYNCFFGQLKRFELADGNRVAFCATGLDAPKFVTMGDFVWTPPSQPCYECMCDEHGLSCCECERGHPLPDS